MHISRVRACTCILLCTAFLDTRRKNPVQSRLSKSDKPVATQNIFRSFANLMFAGKTKDLLSHAEKGSILHLQDPSDPDSPSVRDTLINKHLQGQRAHPKCIIPSLPEEIHPVVPLMPMPSVLPPYELQDWLDLQSGCT